MSTVPNGIVFKVITLHLRAENIAHDYKKEQRFKACSHKDDPTPGYIKRMLSNIISPLLIVQNALTYTIGCRIDSDLKFTLNGFLRQYKTMQFMSVGIREYVFATWLQNANWLSCENPFVSGGSFKNVVKNL